jgi:hypothetical protein
MKISNQRKMRKVIQEFRDAFRRSAIFFHARVFSVRRLVGDRVFDDINIAVVAVPQEYAKALPFIDFDCRNQKSPKRVCGNVDIHKKPRCKRIVAIPGRDVEGPFLRIKKGPLFCGPFSLGLRA